MLIGEVAAQMGLRTSAIRYYESIGLLPAPARSSGRRNYHPDVLQQIAVIQIAQQAGFRIAEIQTLVRGFKGKGRPSKRWRTLAERKLHEIDIQISEAARMQRLLKVLLRCECPTLEDCGRALQAR